MISTASHSWIGASNSDTLAYSTRITGDLAGIDADLANDDEVDVEISWLTGKLNQIFIYCPIEVRLRFNYTTTPQDFYPEEGGIFQWDISSGIPCPVTGNVLNLRITRMNPSEGANDEDIIKVRYNKDATL